jgi:DNA-binding transcriptional LysR family regulator
VSFSLIANNNPAAVLRVREDRPTYPDFFLYYPSRRQLPAALEALIETLRYRPGKG